MIGEIVVVEGKRDVTAVQRAVDADCITTGGWRLGPRVLANLEAAYARRGLVILTDPDRAGEKIRARLSARFPGAKHAFIPQPAATLVNAAGCAVDIGVEQAPPEAIRAALDKARPAVREKRQEFTTADLIQADLAGSPAAAARRAALGAALGLGYANAKQFLRRLNSYGVTREEYMAALASLGEEDKA